jgi:DNA-binding CsgD family transcriptional regulator
VISRDEYRAVASIDGDVPPGLFVELATRPLAGALGQPSLQVSPASSEAVSLARSVVSAVRRQQPYGRDCPPGPLTFTDGDWATFRATPPERFVGRRAELREISARATSAASGDPQTVVIEGVQGIGKTSLLQRALQQLTEFRRLHADCSLGSTADQLTSGIGEASQSGPARAQPGGRLADGLLTTIRALLAESRRPILMALDNVQWLDPESAAAISAVLSALRTAPLLSIVAARDHWQPCAGQDAHVELLGRQLFLGTSLTRLQLAELSVAEIAKLLDRPGPAGSEQAAQFLHAYTGGHPALLSVLLDQDIDLTHVPPGDLLGLSHPLVTSILRAVSCLPRPSRDLLAAMAVSEERWPLATVGSVARVDDPFEALEPLLDLGLVEWFPAEAVAPVCIRYPLYRDVIYRSLPTARREALHDRAAGFALGPRAWVHRAAATDASAPPVAGKLKQEAERYYLAGDNERAGTLLMMSTAATSDPAERARCILQAARWWLTLRAVDWGPKLEACLSRWPESAARSLILGMLAEAAGRYTQARALLADAEELMRADGSSSLLQADIGLAKAFVHADFGDADAQARIADDLLKLGGMPAVHRAWAEYHAATAAGRLSGGPAAALAKLAAVVPDAVIDGGIDSTQAAPGSNSVRLWSRGSWRVLNGQLHDGVSDLARMLRAGDRAAADSVLPLAHAYMGYGYHQLGEWKSAEQAVAQALAALDGHAVARLRVPVHAIAACVDAAAGRHDSAVQHVQAAKRWFAECGPDGYVVFPAIAGAAVAQARGSCEWMLSALQRLSCRPALGDEYQAWWLPLQVEALIGTGQVGPAARVLALLREVAAGSGRHGATVAWLEACVAAAGPDAVAARAAFEEALARQPAPDDVPLLRARLEHDYGRFLMSGRNRRAAIGRLRNAYELYRALGARPFADRCAADLETCGAQEYSAVSAQHGRVSSPVLSSRERKIAYLAAQGLTNQEIAGEVFVTAKTVEYHLGNVFAKLGISSRRQLPSRLGEESAA